MNRDVPLVAIIGRTNVGKSSIFNALTRRKQAIVEDYPGVTRDRRYGVVQEESCVYRLVDTGGFLGEDDNPLQQSVRQQAELAIDEADVVMVVFDGIEGPSPLDGEIVQYMRQVAKPVVWVVNKCEKPVHEYSASEFFQLGIEEYVTISAAHRARMSELRSRLMQELERCGPLSKKLDEESDEGLIRVALIGRPNVGKSTLLNRILGEDRVVTSDVAGTTRDSVDVRIKRDGQIYEFVDTAGLRKKAKVDDGTVERYGNLRSLRALARCDVAILVLDASSDLGALQDSRLAGLAHERGRGLILCVNKWDAVEKDHKTALAYKEYIRNHFKFARYAPTIFISALTGRRCPSVISEVKRVHDASLKRISTADVNKVLAAAFQKKSAPVHRGLPLKLYFAVQIGVKPPTFVLFLNYTSKIHFGYKRYLKNQLREAFGFHGVDIKMYFRKRRGNKDDDERIDEQDLQLKIGNFS